MIDEIVKDHTLCLLLTATRWGARARPDSTDMIVYLRITSSSNKEKTRL